MAINEATLEVVSALPEIERAAAWLDAFAADADVPGEVTAKLHVALDEVLSNVINHAGRHGGPILLHLRRCGQDIELRVVDDGLPFDPRRFEPVPLGVRVAERRVGGAGLLFIRTLMDDIDYTRRDGRNSLVLRKRLPPALQKE